jgi:acetyl esterase/lipase
MNRLLLPLLCLVSTAVAAQQPVSTSAVPTFERIDPPSQPAGAIPLYTGVAPGSENRNIAEVWDRMPDGQPILRNVTRPTLTPVLPDLGKATGAAMIVVPGGGFQMLAMQNEGWAIAQWLADHGIAAFVLKYRILETPADEKALLAFFARSMGAMMQGPEQDRVVKAPQATDDALQAVKIVRAGAAKWSIDPARIGMIGFSAGAIATRQAALAADPKSRPNYIGYIYGPMSAVDVPADAPPMFAALALDDPLFGREGFGIVENWRKARSPVEFHAYEKGSHGFGAGKPGTTTTMMLPELLTWMQSRGLLDNAK